MAFKIAPQEVHYVETNNNVSVRTMVPKEHLEDGTLLLPHVRRMALPADTEIKVSVMNSAYEVLLHTATFVVWKAVKTQKRVMDDDGRGERVVHLTDYLIARRGEWCDSPEIEVTTGITGLDHLESEEVKVLADNAESETKRRPGRPRKTEAAEAV